MTKKASGRSRRLATRRSAPPDESGKLKIGDDWNAIRIIALSQSNPLKAIAEFVENSIDAKARHVTITRFRQNREAYLRITDDGDGVALDPDGKPNFRYVATHICDSIKRRIKAQGESGIQGEFGIGLLSFWTVGQSLSMICAGADGKSYEMRMVQGDPSYTVTTRRALIGESGTRLTVGPLLPGIRHMSGEKLQWFLASELRDRIRSSRVDIRISDRLARAEFAVSPREFEGQLLHHLPLPKTACGDVYVELYLAEPRPDRVPCLGRSGTRVLAGLTELDLFQKSPWNSGYFAGVIDAPFLNLTPGTRLGVIFDERLQMLVESLSELEIVLANIVEEQRQIAGERANRDTIKAIQKAFREALLILPEEEYDWFDLYDLEKSTLVRRHRQNKPNSWLPQAEGESNAGTTDPGHQPAFVAEGAVAAADPERPENAPQQKSFFEHPGPLYSARISPSACTMSVGSSRTFQAVARDQSRRLVTDHLHYHWQITEGSGQWDAADRATVTLVAPGEPQLLKLSLTITQLDNGTPAGRAPGEGTSNLAGSGTAEAIPTAQAEAIITVTDSLVPHPASSHPRRGLPEYTFEKQPGQLWRSRFDPDANLIVINSGHRDFVYAARNKSLKLRYICRLFGKELVLQNFPGASPEQLLERFIELGLYTEENLR